MFETDQIHTPADGAVEAWYNSPDFAPIAAAARARRESRHAAEAGLTTETAGAASPASRVLGGAAASEFAGFPDAAAGSAA